MQLSWSHKLFFLANRFSGRYPWFDKTVAYFAIDALVILGLATFFRVCIGLGWQWPLILNFAARFLIASVIAFTISWLFGWIYPHRRPIVEFPEVKEIVRPLSNWKSLPSDHTIAAFLLVWFLWFNQIVLGISPLVLFGYFVWATVVSVARVFAGVHYPRDIAAGWCLATIVAFLFFR